MKLHLQTEPLQESMQCTWVANRSQTIGLLYRYDQIQYCEEATWTHRAISYSGITKKTAETLCRKVEGEIHFMKRAACEFQLSCLLYILLDPQTSNTTAQVGLDWSQVLQLHLVSHVGSKSPSTWAIMCYLPACINRKLDRNGGANWNRQLHYGRQVFQ